MEATINRVAKKLRRRVVYIESASEPDGSATTIGVQIFPKAEPDEAPDEVWLTWEQSRIAFFVQTFQTWVVAGGKKELQSSSHMGLLWLGSKPVDRNVVSQPCWSRCTAGGSARGAEQHVAGSEPTMSATDSRLALGRLCQENASPVSTGTRPMPAISMLTDLRLITDLVREGDAGAVALVSNSFRTAVVAANISFMFHTRENVSSAVACAAGPYTRPPFGST